MIIESFCDTETSNRPDGRPLHLFFDRAMTIAAVLLVVLLGAS